MVLLWGKAGVPRENLPVSPGNYKPSHVLTQGIEPRLLW